MISFNMFQLYVPYLFLCIYICCHLHVWWVWSHFIDITWVWPPPTNSGKWRFISPTQNVMSSWMSLASWGPHPRYHSRWPVTNTSARLLYKISLQILLEFGPRGRGGSKVLQAAGGANDKWRSREIPGCFVTEICEHIQMNCPNW